MMDDELNYSQSMIKNSLLNSNIHKNSTNKKNVKKQTAYKESVVQENESDLMLSLKQKSVYHKEAKQSVKEDDF